MTAVEVVNVADKLALFSEHWSPKIAGQINDTEIKLVKIKGEFVWHHHDEEDEMFFVVKGQLTMKLHDGDRIINPGEFIIVPRGVEHMPVAHDEVHLMLIERAGTLNTGNVQNERTVANPGRV